MSVPAQPKDSRFRRTRAALLAAALIVPVAGCGLLPEGDSKDQYVEGSVEQLYNTGLDLLKKGEYKEATKYFNEIDRQHPYSAWAARSQLMVGYANYKNADYDTAILTLNRFQRLHPGHRDIAYAYYLQGLSHFEQVRDVKRDQAHTRQAIRAFTVISRRFPDSKYSADATRKTAVLRDHLAGHEMEIGRYYQGRNQHLSAINRFTTVVEDFQGSRHVPEALHRMSESYTSLGLIAEARRTAAVLGHNFPSSQWYRDSYALVHDKKGQPKPVDTQALAVPGARTTTTRVGPNITPRTDPPPSDRSSEKAPDRAPDNAPTERRDGDELKDTPKVDAPPPKDSDIPFPTPATKSDPAPSDSAKTDAPRTGAPKIDTETTSDPEKKTETEEKAERRGFFGRMIDKVF